MNGLFVDVVASFLFVGGRNQQEQTGKEFGRIGRENRGTSTKKQQKQGQSIGWSWQVWMFTPHFLNGCKTNTGRRGLASQFGCICEVHVITNLSEAGLDRKSM